MLDLSYQIRHAFIRRSLSHYTDSLTSTTQDHSQITSQGTQKDIYWESVPITSISAYTHSKKLTKAIRMIQSAKFFGNERVRLFQRNWICKGNRFPVLVHLYGDHYKGLELHRKAAVTARLNLPVFLTSTMTNEEAVMVSECSTNVFQYSHHKLPHRQRTIRRGLESAWHNHNKIPSSPQVSIPVTSTIKYKNKINNIFILVKYLNFNVCNVFTFLPFFQYTSINTLTTV